MQHRWTFVFPEGPSALMQRTARISMGLSSIPFAGKVLFFGFLIVILPPEMNNFLTCYYGDPSMEVALTWDILCAAILSLDLVVRDTYIEKNVKRKTLQECTHITVIFFRRVNYLHVQYFLNKVSPENTMFRTSFNI